MKYFVFRENDQIGRLLWYLYYVPVIALPTLSFFVALSIDDEPEKKMDKKELCVLFLSVGLILTVITNDLHQAVFRFRPGFQNWDSYYDHRIFYYLVAAWVVLLFFGSVAVQVKKCRVSVGKQLFWIPLIPIFLGILYVIL